MSFRERKIETSLVWYQIYLDVYHNRIGDDGNFRLLELLVSNILVKSRPLGTRNLHTSRWG